MSIYKLSCVSHPDFETPAQHFPSDPIPEPGTYKFKNQIVDHFKLHVRLNCKLTVNGNFQYTFVHTGENRMRLFAILFKRKSNIIEWI